MEIRFVPIKPLALLLPEGEQLAGKEPAVLQPSAVDLLPLPGQGKKRKVSGVWLYFPVLHFHHRPDKIFALCPMKVKKLSLQREVFLVLLLWSG